jgi:hypothetical protein
LVGRKIQRWEPGVFSRFRGGEREVKKERVSAKTKLHGNKRKSRARRKKREFPLCPIFVAQDSPVLAVLFSLSVLLVPFWLSHLACPVLVVSFWLSFPFSPALAV